MTTLKLELTDDTYKWLKKSAKARGTGIPELIRIALNLEAVVRDRKVYVESDEQGKLYELQLA
jgi:hypothetical protein